MPDESGCKTESVQLPLRRSRAGRAPRAGVIANRLSYCCADFLTCDKNADCYNFYFTNAARTVTITIKAMPKGSSFSSTVRNRSDSAGAAQNSLVRRFFA